MKINVRQAQGVTDVSLFLTEREADGIARALRSRLEGVGGYQGPGYHLHLEDGEGSELTIGVLDPEWCIAAWASVRESLSASALQSSA